MAETVPKLKMIYNQKVLFFEIGAIWQANKIKICLKLQVVER